MAYNEELFLKFKNIINETNDIIFFGGAGVSTESGIPDFRSVDGLYQQKYKYPPEMIISHDFFFKNTGEFYKFYKEKLVYPEKEPNITHIKLAEMEKEGKVKFVITQNIDGLHQKAGSQNVLELHGSVMRNFCTLCHKFYDMEAIIKATGIPYCNCGGVIKPDVVLYQEALDENVIAQSVQQISSAETLIVAGTSLSVYPAAGLIQYFKGKYLVLINKTVTAYDDSANLLLQTELGEIFSRI